MNVFSGPRLGVAHKRALYRSRRLKDLLTRPELRNYIASLLSLAGDQDREERLELLQTSPLFRCFYQELLAVLQAVPEAGGDTEAQRGAADAEPVGRALQGESTGAVSPRSSVERPSPWSGNSRAASAHQTFGAVRGDGIPATESEGSVAGTHGTQTSNQEAKAREGSLATTEAADHANPAPQAGEGARHPAPKSPTPPGEVTRRITSCEGLCTGRVGLYW